MPAPAKSKALDPDEVVEFYIEKIQFFNTYYSILWKQLYWFVFQVSVIEMYTCIVTWEGYVFFIIIIFSKYALN